HAFFVKRQRKIRQCPGDVDISSNYIEPKLVISFTDVKENISPSFQAQIRRVFRWPVGLQQFGIQGYPFFSLFLHEIVICLETSLDVLVYRWQPLGYSRSTNKRWEFGRNIH